MSRAYEINWIPISTRVDAGDRACIDLALLGILPEPEMVALVREELERDGWKREEDGSLSKSHEELSIRLEADGHTVTIEGRLEREVHTRGESQQRAQENLDAAAKSTTQALHDELRKKIAAVEPEVRAEVDRALQRVYVEAVQRKARTLGQVESMTETRSSDGGYEVTIKLKV